MGIKVKSDWYNNDQAGKKYTYRVKIWDAEDLESWPGIKIPLRVLKIEEARFYQNKKEPEEPLITYLVTTANKVTLPTESVWRMLHRRWDIENKVFHDLKKYWGFGHNYHHDEVAFMAMRWLTVIAMNLFHLFYFRRMHHYYAKGMSKEVLKIELVVSLALVTQAVWEPG